MGCDTKLEYFKKFVNEKFKFPENKKMSFTNNPKSILRILKWNLEINRNY